MKYFIDTEFIEGFHKPLFGKRRHFIDLVSIGIVSEDGREYYAISTEFHHRDSDPWVKKNVLQKLPWWETDLWKSNKQIAFEIQEFCGANRDDRKENISFYGYYSDYDWVLFCSLFGRMIDLPKGFPMYCHDLKQMLDDKADFLTSIQLSQLAYPTVPHNVFETLDTGVIKDRVACLKSAVNYPKQANEHDALDDARWNFNLYKFLTTL